MLALQSRVKGDVPVDHPVVLWLVEHAGELLTECQVGHDGRTPRERLFAKPCADERFEFVCGLVLLLFRAHAAAAGRRR
eukprot:3581181-Alexandrium_andersonii.AAC.1